MATLPAAFMTVVCVSYLCYAKIGFGMSVEMSTLIGIASAAASLVLFLSRGKRMPELENEGVARKSMWEGELSGRKFFLPPTPSHPLPRLSRLSISVHGFPCFSER